MKLKSQILAWQLVIGLLPLMVLLLIINSYAGQLFSGRIQQEISYELNHLKGRIQDVLSRRDGVVTTIASSEALHAYARALKDVNQRQILTRRYQQEKSKLESLLLSMQPLIADDAVIRIIDEQGRTTIKVRFGKTALPQLESLEPYLLIEEEPASTFVEVLSAMDSIENHHIYFPSSQLDYISNALLPLLDVVRKTDFEGQPVYVVMSSQGRSLDALIEVMPRLYQTRLRIVESREVLPDRILYQDNEVSFSVDPVPLQIDADQPTRASGDKDYTVSTEFHPYQDSFNSWTLVATTTDESLLPDIQLFRKGLLVAALLTLLLSIFLTSRISRYLARPMKQLADNMKAYSQGKGLREVGRSNTDEIIRVEASFRQMIASLKHSEDEKHRVNKQLLHNEKLASIGEMAAGIGHELNNPLNNILSLTRLLKRRQADDYQYQADINDLEEEARRASSIVKGILSFARQSSPQRRRVQLCQLVENSIRHVSHLAVEKNLTIHSRINDQQMVYADSAQLEQVLINLLTNAIHASEKSSSIDVTHEDKNDHCCVVISDQGPGIDPKIEGQLFEPFITTRPVGKGSGLGLSISLGLVEAHGGTISIANRADQQGAVATVCLPLTHDHT